jgi:hypothetical protein
MREMLDSASLFAAPLDDWMGRILDRLGDFDLEAAARSTKALVRRRGVQSVRALLHLALARGPGGLSLRETAAWAHSTGVAELNDGSLNDRLHQSCDFLKAIVNAILRAGNAEAPACWPGRNVRLADGSCISAPGAKSGASGTDWRIHAVYDLGQGGFSHLEITDKHGGEAIDRGAPASGEIRIADRGFANAKALRRFLAAAEQAACVVAPDFIVRMRWNACKLADRDGTAFDLIERLRALPSDCEIDEVGVNILGAGEPLPVRLVIRRKAPEHVEAEIRRLNRTAAKHKRELDPRSLVAAGFVVVATSLDEAYPAGEVMALYRLRWQIELAFKRMKSLLHIDELPARSERGGLSWLYAHLILALTVEAEAQDLLDSFPSGPRRGELSQVEMAGL